MKYRWWGLVAVTMAAAAHAQTPAQTPAAGPPSAELEPWGPDPAPPSSTIPAANANSGCTNTSSEPIRRRPGQPVPERLESTVECDPTRLPTPVLTNTPPPAPANRWRVIDALGFPDNWRNPYATNNPIKGDRPLDYRDHFFNLTASSTSLLEERRVPAIPNPDAAHLDGRQQLFESQTFSIDGVYYKGDTIFRPPDYQVRFTPLFNYSNTRTNGVNTSTTSVGAQALFFEKHLRDVSANYDFDSIRIGIQPMTSDFRGFVLADQPLGIRLFGTRDNDVYQYNIGWFRRLPKNAARQDKLTTAIPANDILMANLYVQDLWRAGLTSEFVVIYDRSRVAGTQIVPGVAAAPPTFVAGANHNYDVGYFGYSVDGHVGKLNLTASAYGAFGRESQSTFGVANSMVESVFAAAELSRDFDWIRVRASALYASGDGNPLDKQSHGFDAISQSALFAGSDSSFFIHQRLPLVLNQVDLKVRDSLFPDLRTAADSGESNYTNPGLRLIGLGADFDLAPVLRLSLDANHLWFDQTATLQAIQGNTGLTNDIGTDVAVDAIYRPFNSQNIILRLSAARLFAAPTARQLTGGTAPFSAFGNIVVTY